MQMQHEIEKTITTDKHSGSPECVRVRGVACTALPLETYIRKATCSATAARLATFPHTDCSWIAIEHALRSVDCRCIEDVLHDDRSQCPLDAYSSFELSSHVCLSVLVRSTQPFQVFARERHRSSHLSASHFRRIA